MWHPSRSSGSTRLGSIAHPPDYLHQRDVSPEDLTRAALPYGSLLTFRGVPVHPGRRLVCRRDHRSALRRRCHRRRGRALAADDERRVSTFGGAVWRGAHPRALPSTDVHPGRGARGPARGSAQHRSSSSTRPRSRSATRPPTTMACARCTSCCAARRAKNGACWRGSTARRARSRWPSLARERPLLEALVCAHRDHRRGARQRSFARPQMGQERGDHDDPAARGRARGHALRGARASARCLRRPARVSHRE